MQFIQLARRVLLTIAFLILFVGNTGAMGTTTPQQPFEDTPEPTTSFIFLPYVNRVGTDLLIADIKVIQSTTASSRYAVHIAGRPTEVRVFVGTGSGLEVPGVNGQLCGFDAEGTPEGCISPLNPPITAPSKEEDLESTLNFKVPSSWVKPGFNYFVQIDPKNLFEESNQVNNRFPVDGTQPFGFESVPPLNIVIIPIEYRPFSDANVYYPETGNLSYLTELPARILPIAEIRFEDHLAFTYAPSETKFNLDNPYGYGWVQLLTDLTALHNLEDSAGSKHYYGLVNSYAAHKCGNGCITGIGYLGGHGAYRTAAGWSGWGNGTEAAAETLVHELGHNFGRGHVHCTGRESNPDPNYPYPGGGIGQYGLDPVSGLFYRPDQYADFMSYCDPSWTSDYTYWNIYQYRNRIAAQESNSLAVEKEAIYVSGIITPDGEVQLRPLYRQKTGRLLEPGGDYQLDLLDKSGMVLAGYDFSSYEVPEAPGFQAFGFFVPDAADLDGIRIQSGSQVLAEKWSGGADISLDVRQPRLALAGGEGESVLQWSSSAPGADPVVYLVRVSRDMGKTWQVLALNGTEEALSLPGDLSQGPGDVWVEIQASDGIRSTTQTLILSGSDQ
jgi:hypothetical protein